MTAPVLDRSAIDPETYLLERAMALLPALGPDEVAELLATNSTVRREVTYDDPLAFALCYLIRHLKSEETDNQVTFSDFHLELIELAKEWMEPVEEPGDGRHAFVAPRAVGKSTLLFLVLPLWAAAHEHLRFIAAFSDSSSQAELHLQTLKRELDENVLLRADYPDLCRPAKRSSGVKVSDNRGLMLTGNGFAFAAKGLDGSTLGLKVGSRRPDLLILDDVEPGEAQYSAYQVQQRLKTIQDVVLPLSDRARVMWTGTVTMPGSLVHQLVLHARGDEQTGSEWIVDERFEVHYFPAILVDDDGTERSIWPEKWSIEYLVSIRHTRSFLKNFQNLPVPSDGAYWSREDFRYGRLETITRTVLSIDPAVTGKKTSDKTGLAVVSYSPSEQKCVVEYADDVRLAPGEPLRAKVLQLLQVFPHITAIHVEVDQGGETWRSVFHDLPPHIRLSLMSSQTVLKGSKAQRAAHALTRYQQGRVLHATKLDRYEEQALFFSGRDGQPDDMVDAVTTAVNLFLPPIRTGGGLRVHVARP